VLQIVEPGDSHLKCGAHNLMTETMSLWTISIVSKDKLSNRDCCIPQSMGNTTEERESECEQ
jgi:hypothetical protein